MRELVQDRDF